MPKPALKSNNVKKVLFITRPITPPWDEASKNFTFDLVNQLKSVQSTILTSTMPPSLTSPRATSLRLYTSAKLTIWQKLRLLALIFFRPKFNIFHFMLTPSRLNALMAKIISSHAKLITIQTIATVRDDRYTPHQLKSILFADYLITYSDYAKNKLEQQGFDNVTRIYPGLNLLKYSPGKQQTELANKYNVTSQDFVVTYPGEYSRLGATDMLVDIVPRLSEIIPNFRFAFACRVKSPQDQIVKAEIMAKMKQVGIADKIIYTDTVSDMNQLYNMSDVVLFPVTRMEGKFDVPLVIIEAMACAKPVILSDLPVFHEFADSSHVLTVRAGDSDQLISQIARLAKQPELRQKLANNARIYVEKNFDVNQIAQQYDQLYQSIQI